MGELEDLITKIEHKFDLTETNRLVPPPMGDLRTSAQRLIEDYIEPFYTKRFEQAIGRDEKPSDLDKFTWTEDSLKSGYIVYRNKLRKEAKQRWNSNV